MKRFIKGALLFTLLIMMGVGCKKEELTKTTVERTKSAQIENGLWVFATQADYYTTVLELAKMTSEERQKWGSKMNFVSQQIQFENILRAEDAFDAAYLKGIDPNLSKEELAELGKTISHSQTYKDGLKSGLISQIEEEDGGTSFVLNVSDPSVAYVTNTSGMVVIDGFLYQHGKTSVKIMPYDGTTSIGELKSASSSNEGKDINVINLDEKATNSFYRGDIFAPGSNSIIWYYNSSNERFKHSVHFTSTNFVSGGSSHVYCQYYTQSIAEKKNIFGNWKISNSYQPIKALGGTWNFHYWKKKAGTFDPEIYSSSLVVAPGTGALSPFYIDFGNHNNVSIPLFPSGTWTIASPYYFYTPVDINNGSTWNGVFWGGPSGYTTNYNR